MIYASQELVLFISNLDQLYVICSDNFDSKTLLLVLSFCFWTQIDWLSFR